MDYHIEKKLSPEELTYLKSFIGKEFKTVSVLPADRRTFSERAWCLSIELTTSHEKLVIMSDVLDERDHDEYFQLRASDRLTRWSNCELEPVHLNFSAAVTDIEIYRDTVSWSNENAHWEVEADVAILLRFKDAQILFKAIDSLAGFIAIYSDPDSIRRELEDIQSTWLAFKADRLDHSERRCLSLK